MLSRNRRSKSGSMKDEKKEQESPATMAQTNTTTSLSNYKDEYASNQQQEGHHPSASDQIPAIFAAPTVDTLDDQSVFVANGRHRARGPLASSKSQRQQQDESGVMRHVVSFTPQKKSNNSNNAHTMLGFGALENVFTFDTHGGDSQQFQEYTYHHSAHSPSGNSKSISNSNTGNNFADFSSPQAQIALQKETGQKQAPIALAQQRKRRKPTASTGKARDFQNPEDAAIVTIRHVSTVQRAAFDVRRMASVDEWHMTAQRLASHGNISIKHAERKLSPSLQHLKLIHAMQSVTTIRQLCFSPSVGIHSDLFVPWWQDALPTTTAAAAAATTAGDDASDRNKTRAAAWKRRASGALLERDGRYRSIHPVEATLAGLPTVPPSLSNKKTRLPLRADVGFPNASQEDMEQKQAEIQQETEWEEASPRIIVLVTSDDLGTAVQDDDACGTVSREHLLWNAGGLQSMPWAGKDLLRAKELNALHFSKKSSLFSKSLMKNTEQSGSGNNNLDSIKKKILEPNRTSILAPPLDASYSKTLGWRPRPFHDRPPGMEYLLCWPTDIRFHNVGKIEPLLCSLALYNLPSATAVRDVDNNSNGVYGKISEEFWFPAGDWEGKMELDPSCFSVPVPLQNSSNDTKPMAPIAEEVLISWRRRNQKAIFSYDPLAIRGGRESLFWVVQVFKVATDETTNVYLQGSKTSNKRSGSVKNLFTGSKASNKQPSSENIESEKLNANEFFKKFGTNLMTPLAYGVQPAVPQQQEQMLEFPKGVMSDVTLLAAAAEPESPDDFIDRVSKVSLLLASNGDTNDFKMLRGMSASDNDAGKRGGPNGSIAFDTSSLASSVSDRSLATSSNLRDSSTLDRVTLTSKSDESTSNGSPAVKEKKKSIVKRMFTSPKKAARPAKSPTSSVGQTKTKPTGSVPSTQEKRKSMSEVDPELAATASIFSSTLSTDWLQSMLSEPTQSDGSKLQLQPQGSTASVPKILCDISGDYAVMLESNYSSKKRSNLLRLPSHTRAAGYLGASDIREMLFLPARPEKQYDLDIPPSYRSLINLLYLSPRLLRSSDDCRQKKTDVRARYTVRVRLVRSSLDLDGNKIASANKPLQAFHSTATWAGSSLVKDVYTKIPGRPASNKSSKGGKQMEQAMRDEFKLRLPMILDGTYFLQFTLYEITGDKAADPRDISLRAVGDNSIPLSSSNVRDTAGAMKVATVIPNGCHRLKLGDFRLYVESRLVSSVHVGDAAVAAAIRDFPVSFTAEEDRPPNQATLSRFLPSESAIADSALGFPALFTSASDGTIVEYFQLLLYSHLSNLVQGGLPSTAAANFTGRGDFMMGNLISLFGIFKKLKHRLDSVRLNVFLKIIFDEFDESFLLPKKRSIQTADEESSEAGSESDLKTKPRLFEDQGTLHDDTASEDNVVDEGAVRVRHKDSLRDGIEKRLNRRKSMGVDAGDRATISRVAYGASKTDRLKIEAELYNDKTQFAHLYDDDETIVTSGTAFQSMTIKEKQQAALAIERLQNNGQLQGTPKMKQVEDFYSDSSIQAATAAASRAMQGEQQQTNENEGFATRVKTVANVMLAPCVGNGGPSPRRLSLDCGRSRRRSPKGGTTQKAMGPATKECFEEATLTKKAPNQTIVLPGSDDEDAQFDDPKSRYSMFRGYSGDAPLTFSIQDGQQKQEGAPMSVSGGNYLYESIIFLWLSAWSDYIAEADGNNDVPIFSPNLSNNALADFFIHKDILLPITLKSLAVRYGSEVQATNDLSLRACLDAQHVGIFKSFVEVLGRSVMGQALSHSAKGVTSDEKDAALLRSLASSDLIVEWFEGLFTILHPEHMRSLIVKYFQTLNACETEHLQKNKKGMLEFQWTEAAIHRVRASRQLRLRAVEKLAVLPFFMAVNFPPKFSDNCVIPSGGNGDSDISSWKVQYGESANEIPLENQPDQIQQRLASSGDGKRPEHGWLARLLADEALSVCALSCEAVVAEAVAQVESSNNKSQQNRDQSKKSPFQLERSDLLMFQGLAIHAITAFYELVLRRHAMDTRFQTNACRCRIAGLYAEVLFTQSLKSVRWLARMESSHKVRSLWMLCLVYVLQESPEVLIRNLVKSYCDPKDILIHRFIRLLRLASSTCQSFIDQQRFSTFPEEVDKGISPWLLQESFNTICASANIVVEECVKLTESNPKEQRKMIHAVLDLFLHILTTPQSAVTHLRAVGGAIFAFEKFGVELFLDVVGKNLQHWIRVVQSLMNSTSLSVRSISVDFVISLLGGAFDLLGSVDEICLIFATVLPEVTAREIGLYSVDGHVNSAKDLERAIWPLRRSLAEIEDANPLDDDRIDPELSSVLKTFCRASQAVLDGVLIELRLKRDECYVVGKKVEVIPISERSFDADEESLFEAADFFLPEFAPMQRLRWLLTLKSLHEAKEQWLEAAECLVACANTISDAMPHLQHVWRPTKFPLWSDARRSTWLSTVGEDLGHPDRGNTAVMSFADEFLEPNRKIMLNTPEKRGPSGTLPQPTVVAMCSMLSSVAREAVECYLREDGMDEIAYSRLENLLRTVMTALGEYGSLGLHHGRSLRAMNLSMRKQHVEEEAALRRVVAGLSSEMTKLAERFLLFVRDNTERPQETTALSKNGDKTSPKKDLSKRPYYVLVEISGNKPPRFQESTTLPTFLDWSMPCVCRVPPYVVNSAHKAARGNPQILDECICLEYGKPLQQALTHETSPDSILLRVGDSPMTVAADKTVITVTLLQPQSSDGALESLPLETKHFFYSRKPALSSTDSGTNESERVLTSTPSQLLDKLVEVTVAKTFPSALSRQRTLLTKEFDVAE